MPDGTLNIDQLFVEQPAAASSAPAATAATAPAEPGKPATATAAAPEAPWTVTVANVTLRDAAVSYEDRAVKPVARFELSPLDVTATDASLDLSQPLPVKFDATINGAAKLSGTGHVVPEPFAADVDIDLAGFPLKSLQPYANGTTDLTIQQGTVAANGKFTLAPPGTGQPELQFAGNAAIANFKSIDNALEQDFVNFERIELSQAEVRDGARLAQHRPRARRQAVRPGDRELRRRAQRVRGVRSAGHRRRGGKGEGRQGRTAGAPPARKKSRAEIRAEKQGRGGGGEGAQARGQRRRRRNSRKPACRSASAKCWSAGGTMDFADFSVQPNFAAAIESLDGVITGMSSDPNSRATVKLDGNVGEYSPVLISGTTQPFAFDRHTDITMKFENISLPVFNPYSGKFAGYNIAKGKLFTDLHYQVDNRKLEAQHKIRIDQLEWGEATASKEEATLPVKFATSLLKDADGVITLDIPVSGTLDDPTLRIGPIVWQVIKNILAKAVTAPFKALGALFAGAEEAQFIDFAPGSAVLDPAAAERLGALGKSLAPKPDLRLEVPIGADAVARRSGPG